MDYGLNRALDAWYNDRTWFQGLQRRVMLQARSGGGEGGHKKLGMLPNCQHWWL